MHVRTANLAVSLWLMSFGASAAGSTATVCLVEDFKLGSVSTLTIQRGTVFRNHGPISGDITGAWKLANPRTIKNAAIVTVMDVTLTKSRRCAKTQVLMHMDNVLNKEASAKVSDNDYWGIDDNIEYVPGRKPPIELGKLVDDIAVVAQLREDVTEVRTMLRPEPRDAERCLNDAKSLASLIGGGVHRQTSSVVVIRHPAAQEMTITCNFERPSIFIAWNNRAKPAPSTLQLIEKAGAVLTGAPQDTIKALVTACVTQALEPENNEIAEYEIDGVRAECQSFSRDGGAGAVTILRRFGPYPPLTPPRPH